MVKKDWEKKLAEIIAQKQVLFSKEGPNVLAKLNDLNQKEKELQNMPQVTLRLAKKFSATILSKADAFWEKNIGKQVVLNAEIEPKLIAGAVTEYNGHISCLTPNV